MPGQDLSYVAPPMLKRGLVLIVVLGVVLALGTASDTSAGSIADFAPCPKSATNGDLVCPVGTTGQPYSIKFRGDEDPICAPGDDKWYATNGTVPPGLALAEDGRLSGTPTKAGSYSFWLELKLPDYFNGTSGCSSRDNSEERVSITILQGLAKLTVGPESTTPGTTGQPYSLQLTATVPEAKTWSITAGSLPTGLGLDANTGLISGTPTTSGQFDFEVMAHMNADARSDTKILGIVIREPVVIASGEPFSRSRRAWGEVSAPFEAVLTVSGGTGAYAWSLTKGVLPRGVVFAEGALSGTPRKAGSYSFVVTAVDTEDRIANHTLRIAVAAKLSVRTRLLRPGRVGKLYQARLTAGAGVKPMIWRVSRGTLPKGLRLDARSGKLHGTPTRADRYRLRVEVSDALGVVATRTLRIVIAGAPRPVKTKV